MRTSGRDGAAVGGAGGGGVENSNSSNGGRKGSTVISSMSESSWKMVQSLKEIVNCSDAEIYAALKDCNMDPNDAVTRLLSQDPFHEVKSKRDKKKENKNSTELRSRGASNMAHRGGRGSTERYGRGGSSQFSSNDSSNFHNKPSYKRENGMNASAGSSSSAAVVLGNDVNRRPPSQSDYVATENTMPTTGVGDVAASSLQPASGFQSSWSGVPGQRSMADIVKMGRPQNKVSAVPTYHSNQHLASATTVGRVGPHSSENYIDKVSEIIPEHGVTGSQHDDQYDEWPSIEQPPAASVSSVLEPPADSNLYADSAYLPVNRGIQQTESQLDDTESGDDHDDTLNGDFVGPTSGASSVFEGTDYSNVGTFEHQRQGFEHDKDEGPSYVAANLQQLSLHGDDGGSPPEEDKPSVIIPNHLQVHAQECSHLSFGSFGSAINSAFSGSFASRKLADNLEETSEVPDESSAANLDARNSEYYGDEHLRNATDENLIHGAGVSAGNYDSTSVPQSDALKEESPETVLGSQYAFPSTSGYTFDNSQQLDATFNSQQTSSQMQHIAPFSNVMQAYNNSLPSTLLASTVQSGREADLPYSPFPMAQSMAAKYNNEAATLSGATISTPEALRAANMSTAQPTSQTLPGANMATGPALPQQLAVHPYSQPTLPLGHFANMIGYPFLPQNYTYVPSAFQQSFAGNNTYHQSLAAMLPPYKSSVSVSSLPQSAAVASGYGFGSSTSIPAGNFPLNPPNAPGGTSIGYEDLLSSQYKDASHLMSLQQNENSAMWVQGPGSRTMSAVPPSTYYGFQGQNQQPGGFRQGQQPSQHFSNLGGYPNYYHSQAGVSLEHQQQNTRDGSFGGSQGQPSKQTQQLWQNSY